ncbi:MAG: response regulator transcription factor [Actinomycetota bacterium]
MSISPEDHRFTVLLVDDQTSVRGAMKRGLEASGFFRVVAEAEDGDEALAATKRLDPDVVMLDLSMPKRGGLDVLPALRACTPSSLVAVLSGIGPQTLGKQVWQSGADLYLEKTSAMRDIVAELLTELQVRQAVGASS